MIDDIVQRLREQGKDAFATHYSLGMFKLCVEAADEIERLRKALEFIRDGYDNQYVNHVDYRVKVYQVALDALASVGGAND